MHAFQQRVLPRAVFDEPEIWSDEDPTSLVIELGALLEQWPAPSNPTLDQISIRRLTIRGHRVTILEFAGVHRVREAYFVALVSDRFTGGHGGDAPVPRFVTLELANRGPPLGITTMICEWGMHGRINRGPGPRPIIGAFVAALRHLL